VFARERGSGHALSTALVERRFLEPLFVALSIPSHARERGRAAGDRVREGRAFRSGEDARTGAGEGHPHKSAPSSS